MYRIWQPEEIDFLIENWGKYQLPTLARKLNRTEKAIIEKTKRLGLGPSKTSQGYLTALDLARALGVTSHTVKLWIVKYRLKSTKKITRTKHRYYQIDTNDWWKWAEINQDKFDSRRIEPMILGSEPGWMIEKRKNDLALPRRNQKIWTPEDDKQLKALYHGTLLTYREIGERLGRSRDAVTHRLRRIGVC